MNKLSKHMFLMLGMASVFSMSGFDAMGAKDYCDKVSKGNYCFKRNNKPSCPRNCYCPGSGGRNVDQVENSNNGLDNKSAVENACKNKYGGVKSYLEERGVFYCPDDFPYSDNGKSDKTDCYAVVENENGVLNSVYMYEEIKCASGKYLPERKKVCSDCSDKNNFCPGGTFVLSLNGDVGIYKCAGTVKDKKQCKIKCEVGKYMKKGTQDCSSCMDGYICPNTTTVTLGPNLPFAEGDYGLGKKCESGTKPNDPRTECVPDSGLGGGGSTTCPAGQYLLNGNCKNCEGNTISSGGSVNSCTSCPSGEVANSAHTVCLTNATNTITVQPGTYLPKGTSTVKACYGTYNYCPGGFFAPSSDKDQGIYQCPLNGVTTNGGKACKLSLGKSVLENGASGEGDCWKISTATDYKRCVFGTDMVNAPNTSSKPSDKVDKNSFQSKSNFQIK